MANEYSSAVDCAEEHASQAPCEESYDEDSGLMSAQVTLRCAWADRHTLAADICGNRNLWPKGGFGITPRAARASIRPWIDAGGVTGQMIYPTVALVTIFYSTKDVDIITESIEPTAEFVTIDYRYFNWGSGGADSPLREEEAPGKLVRGLNFVRSEMYVQPPLPNGLLTLPGSVNDAEFTSTLLDGFVFAEETLLFQAPIITRKIKSGGGQQYDLTKKWSYNQHGWNTYYRAKTNEYVKIYRIGESDPWESYPVADMSSIL